MIIIIHIAIKIQWHIVIQLTFYDSTRVLLLLLLHLFIKIIEITMDIDLIQLNYDLLQALICVFEFDYMIRSINFLKQWLVFIQDTNDEVEFFLVFFDIFLTVFNTTQSRHNKKLI